MKKNSGSDKASLAGTSWVISNIPGLEKETTNKPVTLSFSDSSDRFGGSTGCNGFGGTYTVKGNHLELGKILLTKMACMPGMNTERKLVEAMQKTDNYAVKDGVLQLKRGDEVVAEFTKSIEK